MAGVPEVRSQKSTRALRIKYSMVSKAARIEPSPGLDLTPLPLIAGENVCAASVAPRCSEAGLVLPNDLGFGPG